MGAGCSIRLLVAGRETTRSFTLGVVLDLENPAHAAQDAITPAFVVPVEDGPPSIGPSGWLAQADSKNVVISHLEFVEKTAGDRGWGLAFHLLETGGHATRCRLRLVPQPVLGPPGRLSGRHDHRPHDPGRRGADRLYAVRAGAG